MERYKHLRDVDITGKRGRENGEGAVEVGDPCVHRGESGDALRREIPVFSFKRETVRGVNANTDDNKEARVQAIETLNRMIRGGYRWVCLDESSWCVATTAVYGWSKRGERCFVTNGRNGIRITSTATIDATVMGDFPRLWVF